MQLFFFPNDPGDLFLLPEEEARHLIRSLRHQVGDLVLVTNGKGLLLKCEISDDNYQHCELKVIERKQVPLPEAGFHLVIAPTKQTDRIEWCLEKCVEMGIKRFTPVISSRTERVKLKSDRLERIVISALKQSGNFFLPQIDEPVAFDELLADPSLCQQRFIAHLNEGDRRELIDLEQPGNAVVLIGPEGDFTDREVGQALRAGFMPVSLGSSRLRTETAGIYACAAFHFINSRQ